MRSDWAGMKMGRHGIKLIAMMMSMVVDVMEEGGAERAGGNRVRG